MFGNRSPLHLTTNSHLQTRPDFVGHGLPESEPSGQFRHSPWMNSKMPRPRQNCHISGLVAELRSECAGDLDVGAGTTLSCGNRPSRSWARSSFRRSFPSNILLRRSCLFRIDHLARRSGLDHLLSLLWLHQDAEARLSTYHSNPESRLQAASSSWALSGKASQNCSKSRSWPDPRFSDQGFLDSSACLHRADALLPMARRS